MTERERAHSASPPVPSRSNTLSAIGIACGAVAAFYLPLVIGLAGLVCAVVAKRRREPLATPALVVSFVGTALGVALIVLGHLIRT